MVSVWPEPPSAMPAGVHDGMEAFALITTERSTSRLTRNLVSLARRDDRAPADIADENHDQI